MVYMTCSNYHLGEESPVIDAGDNTALPAEIRTDRSGFPRYWDIVSIPDTGNGMPPIVDMGAYEYFDGERVFLTVVFK